MVKHARQLNTRDAIVIIRYVYGISLPKKYAIELAMSADIAIINISAKARINFLNLYFFTKFFIHPPGVYSFILK